MNRLASRAQACGSVRRLPADAVRLLDALFGGTQSCAEAAGQCTVTSMSSSSLQEGVLLQRNEPA